MVEEQLLTAVKSEGGLLQSEVWKKFDIDSKKASRVIRDMEDQGLIKRRSVVSNGSRTYLVEYKEEDSPLESLFSGNVLSPCIDCSDECRPAACVPLGEWVAAE